MFVSRSMALTLWDAVFLNLNKLPPKLFCLEGTRLEGIEPRHIGLERPLRFLRQLTKLRQESLPVT